MVGTAIQGLRHDGVEPDGNGGVPIGERRWILVESGERGGGLGVGVERWGAGQHLVEHGPEGVDIGARVRDIAPELLGSDVLGGAQDRARVGEIPTAFGLGDAEVGHQDATVVGQHDVGGLDVAMDDAGEVGGVQGVGHVGRDLHRPRRTERAVLLKVFPKGLAPHQFHHDRVDALDRDRVVDRHDAAMVQSRRRPGLVAEPRDEAGIVGQVTVQDLDRHPPVQRQVEGAPDLRHPAGGQEIMEFVAVGEPSTGRDGTSL